MKHMAIMGLMLAFALPAASAETESQQERQARELEISLRHALNDWSNIADLGRIFYRDEDDEIIAYPAVTRQEWERKYEQARRQRQEAAEREWQERQARELAQRQAQTIPAVPACAEREKTIDTVKREWEERHDAKIIETWKATFRPHDDDEITAEQERREQIWQERQERIEAERERRERTDALPPKARLAGELCHDADAVMGMAVRVSREKLSGDGYDGHISGPDEILHVIKTDRRYLYAAPAETALKLSRLARNLRQEAKLWGFPCAPPSHSPPNGPVQAP